MKCLFVLIIACLLTLITSSKVHVRSLSIRHLRKNDFGLIFDAIVKNDEAAPKESLSFEVRSDACCLQIQDKWDCNVQGMNAAKVFNLEPGKEMIVSLVWPTLVLYNRVGNCSVVVETFRAKGNTIDDSRLVSFNTTVVSESIHDYLFYYFNDMKKSYGYQKCLYEDLDPFQQCKPVNCEEKYFGKRNFFDKSKCIASRICDESLIYDYKTNECHDLRKVLSDSEIEEIKSGQFTNWIDLKSDEVQDIVTQSEEKTAEKIYNLKRMRRSMHHDTSAIGETFSSSLWFVLKLIVSIMFVYFVMCITLYLLFYICLGCRFIVPPGSKTTIGAS